MARRGQALLVGGGARAFERRALLDELAAALARQFGRETIAREHRFHPTRRWAFDVAVRTARIAVEVQGFGPKGGHGKAYAGLEGDCEKYAEAAARGWIVIPCTYRMLRRGAVAALVAAASAARPLIDKID